jgi:putative ABC transport system ATP-binding protein
MLLNSKGISMSTLLLEAENLSHRFDYPLYHDVSVSLSAKQSMAVVGRSGSGKSTLLHTLSTFLKPNSGSVKLLGKDIYVLSAEALELLRRDELGIIFQAHYLFKGMTGRENIEIASLLSGDTVDTSVLEQLEIADVIDQKIGDLSGGQQQRVSIARVLSKKPKLIFADEPTGNLDGQTANLVIDVLLSYIQKEKAALFLVTHDDIIASRCDFHYRLEAEHLVAL